MRLQSIRLQWFRGAATEAILDLGGRSAIIYGANGAGKSSFVDGVEAVLSTGKIGHLAHEYAGRNQEKGLINISRPSEQCSEVEITLVDKSSETLTWHSSAPARVRQGVTSLGHWDYRRTVLRQEDLSEFIRDTKRDKYSAVLPLLGLSRLEAVAENLRKLVKAIERKGDLASLRATVTLASERHREVFGDQTREGLLGKLEELRLAYASTAPVVSRVKTASDVLSAINDQIASLDSDQRTAAAIAEIGASDLESRLSKVSSSAAKIAEVAEPLIKERLEVLGAAAELITAASDLQGSVSCPACGRDIEASKFREHVSRERDRLSVAQKLYDEHRIVISEVCDEAHRLRDVCLKADLTRWRDGLPPTLSLAAVYLSELSVPGLRNSCGLEDIEELRARVLPLVARAVEDARALQPTVQSLIEHQREARALAGLLKASAVRAGLNRADALISLVRSLETEVYEEIAQRARKTFDSISCDIQRYWEILQPNDVIKDVQLVVPENNDKAVEIVLRFYGKVQDSPRLTLSEGQRNALGLCIFLAMANKAGDSDRPIVLDDVVISFDREHRSRVGMLLRQEFAARQIVLLTHDREWFFELQRTMPGNRWSVRRLLPYSTPQLGITFADHGTDLAAAKARAKTDPEEALANVRRLMDVALSEIAERVSLPMPHLRGGDNDHRTAGQFLVALERAASRSFRIKVENSYEPHGLALAAIKKIKPELAIWANRGTHSFSGSTSEAEDLIDGCETVLSSFMCDSCGTPVGVFGSTGGKVECRCGSLQWRPQ